MAKRDYDSTPVTKDLGLDTVITGLVRDLENLRARRITPSEAIAHAMLAKQIFNGCRIYMQGLKHLSDSARDVTPSEDNLIEGRPA